MGGEEVIPGETQDLSLPTGQEERILVLVRVRPLNEKERAKNDVSDWECINNSTIIYKNSLLERSMYPAAYSFDRVFGHDCPTARVYDEGAKEVALSVVSGINSTIFAYGQTSSGKTYTMRGITEFAMQDIYDYIDKHEEREFVLKFSAMEIYNESVRDLLISDTTPLRLLDDPERGTVVERLTEETLRDLSHLKELLAICEAQRQIGETSLNETSSRSHQILRLTIESSAREYVGAGNSSTLAASVNFVDLAGSERASQTLNAGARLKEGCHINRSLLTLGTVIRKLSKGRNAHVPYRDSKLTRILQNSLGGNGRTAIICTMSPARSHIEQSRNTLLFASCAKEVATNARVNVVMSDKALVKQLQRELARLEGEMKSITSTSTKGDTAASLKEKELVIEQMDREIRELTRQRDIAQSRADSLLQSIREYRASRLNECSEVESTEISNSLHSDLGLGTHNIPKNDDGTPKFVGLSANPEDNFLLDNSTPKFVGLDPCQGWDDIAIKTCKEVRCVDMKVSTINGKTDSDVFLPGSQEKEGKLSMTDALDEAAVSSPDESITKKTTENYVLSPGSEERKLSTTESMDETAISSPSDAVRCIEMEESSIKKTAEAEVLLPGSEEGKLSIKGDIGGVEVSSPRKEDIESNRDKEHTYEAMKQKIQELQKTINYLVSLYPVEQSPASSADVCISRSASCRAVLVSMPTSPALENAEQNENTPSAKNVSGRSGVFDGKLYDSNYSTKNGNLTRKDSQTSISAASIESQSIKEYDAEDTTSIYDHSEKTYSLLFDKAVHTPSTASENNFAMGADRKLSKLQYGSEIGRIFRKDYENSTGSPSTESRSFKESDEDSGIHQFVSGQSKIIQFQSPKKFGEYLVPQTETDTETDTETEEPGMKVKDGLVSAKDAVQPLFNWPAEFERRRREIIELWNACNVPLVHRSYFFLLFKGDPSDSVYMEVELRRLTFLKGGNFTKESLTSSLKSLSRERETLSKQVHRRYSRREREELYELWGIHLNTKQRSLQLARRLWSNTIDMDHITESASLVAKLVGFVQAGQAPKEIFGLTFSSPASTSRRSYSWRPRRSSLL